MNLPALSSASASPPKTDFSTPAQGHAEAGKPTERPFNHVLGSLITDREKSSEPVNAKKQQSNQDSSTLQAPSTTGQTAQPVILPALLRLHLMVPGSSKGGPDDSNDGDVDNGEDLGTNLSVGATYLLSQLAATQLTPQTSVSVPPANGSSTQPVGQGGQPVSGVLLSDSEKLQLALKTDEAKPLPKAELAFSARITPATTPASGHTNEPAAPLANSPAGPESSVVSAVGASQQADTNANSDSGQPPRQSLKLQSKIQSEVTVDTPNATSAAGNPHLVQDTVPALVTTPAPNNTGSPTKQEVTSATSQPIDARPAAVALPDPNTASKLEPVRDLSIRIGNNPGSQVDVKIQERAGEVRVSVLSSGSTLTSDLRQQVGDLVGRLDRAGYHAETFKPTSSTASQQSSNQPDSGQERDSSGSQQRQQQQDTSRQQLLGRQKRSNQTQWLQQMNGSFGPNAN